MVEVDAEEAAVLLQVGHGVSAHADGCGYDAGHAVFQGLCLGFVPGQCAEAAVVFYGLPEAVALQGADELAEGDGLRAFAAHVAELGKADFVVRCVVSVFFHIFPCLYGWAVALSPLPLQI